MICQQFASSKSWRIVGSYSRAGQIKRKTPETTNIFFVSWIGIGTYVDIFRIGNNYCNTIIYNYNITTRQANAEENRENLANSWRVPALYYCRWRAAICCNFSATVVRRSMNCIIIKGSPFWPLDRYFCTKSFYTKYYRCSIN
jgi:hypothetical protein